MPFGCSLLRRGFKLLPLLRVYALWLEVSHAARIEEGLKKILILLIVFPERF